MGGWIMALFLSCLFVCLFAAVEQDEKTWPTLVVVVVNLLNLQPVAPPI